MKKRLIMILAAAIIILIGCVKYPAKLGIHPSTLYKGRVIEKSQNKPIKGVIVSVTDGSHVHTSQVTGDDGRFEFRVDFDAIDENYSLQLDCQGYTSIKENLKGFGQESYDYKDIVYYDNSNSSNWPNVTTTDVLDVTSTTARTGGTITYSGAAEITARGVCWGTSHTPNIDGNHTTDGEGTGSFTSNLTNLDVNLTYYVRAYATNIHGTYYGEEKTFTTSIGLPTVNITSVSNITATSATCGGNVSDNGGFAVTDKGLVWSTTQYPTLTDNHISLGSGNAPFTGSMTNLSIGTTYYVRAFATNSQGTAYSSTQKTFTTSDGLPSVVIDGNSFTLLSSTSVSCTSNVTSNGGFAILERGICWGDTPNPTITNNHTNDGTGTGYYTSVLSNLDSNHIYYVRSYVTNAIGTAYSNQVVLNMEYILLPSFTYNGHVYKVAPDPQQQYYEYLSWDQANSYCENLTAYGFSDWRLPDIEELEMMYQKRYSIGGFIEPTSESYSILYHSSTAISPNNNRCYLLNWSDGSRYYSDHLHFDGVNMAYTLQQCAHVRPIRIDH